MFGTWGLMLLFLALVIGAFFVNFWLGILASALLLIIFWIDTLVDQKFED